MHRRLGQGEDQCRHRRWVTRVPPAANGLSPIGDRHYAAALRWIPVSINNQGAWQGLVLPQRSLRRETQDREADEQKERQDEAKNEHDALPRPAQNDFTPARLLARIGCRLFLAHHRILTQ